MLLALLSVIGSYTFLGLLGTIIPFNWKYRRFDASIQCFIISNGVHTDFLVPIKNRYFDWSRIIDLSHYELDEDQIEYLAFGWGDRGFYLEIPRWADLTPRIAANAMLVPSPTLMHVTAYHEVPDMKKVEPFFINEEKYDLLCRYILNQFKMVDQSLVILEGVGYSPNDNFYHANGSYHAFNTCNFWINKGLQKIGVRTSLWSPWDKGLFFQIRKVKAA